MPNSEYLKYFPAQVFGDRLGNCQLITQSFGCAPTATTVIISNTAGKRVRVVAATMVNDSVATAVLPNLRSGAAGNTMMIPNIPGTSQPMLKLDFNPAGWMETATGEGIQVVNGAVPTLYINLTYFFYTP